MGLYIDRRTCSRTPYNGDLDAHCGGGHHDIAPISDDGLVADALGCLSPQYCGRSQQEKEGEKKLFHIGKIEKSGWKSHS